MAVKLLVSCVLWAGQAPTHLHRYRQYNVGNSIWSCRCSAPLTGVRSGRWSSDGWTDTVYQYWIDRHRHWESNIGGRRRPTKPRNTASWLEMLSWLLIIYQKTSFVWGPTKWREPPTTYIDIATPINRYITSCLYSPTSSIVHCDPVHPTTGELLL